MFENHYSKNCPKVIALSLDLLGRKITTMIVFSIPKSLY